MLRTLLFASIILFSAWAPAAGETGGAGRLMGQTSPEFEKAQAEAWAHRSLTYEIYHHEAQSLARLVYALARHSGDIDQSMAPERFVTGVKGFHYQIGQVCDWLNDLLAGRSADPALDEMVLAGLLLEDRVLTVKGGRFVPAGPVRHILGAAPGRKRSFADNLRHERLHVAWDEDPDFRQKARKEWDALGQERQAQARRQLPQYPAEAQLIEEWAVGQAEKKNTE